MKEIYEKTITSIFIMPTLEISREDLFNNKFINAYLGDLDKEEYHEEDVIFLLFNPKDLNLFREFLNFQYENHSILDDYDYEKGYIVLVYSLNSELRKDFNLIKNSKYSKVSQEFKDLFPLKIINFSKKGKPSQESIQHMIFNRDIRLINFWEKEFDTNIISIQNLESWPQFDEQKEVLDIEKIIENEKNN